MAVVGVDILHQCQEIVRGRGEEVKEPPWSIGIIGMGDGWEMFRAPSQWTIVCCRVPGTVCRYLFPTAAVAGSLANCEFP